MKNQMIKGILFDFDDTLVNTSGAILRARKKVFTQMNRDYGIKYDDYEKAVKDTSVEFDSLPPNEKTTKELYYDIMAKHSRIDFSKEKKSKYADIFDEEFINDTEFAIGIEETIGELKNLGLKLGILTGSGGSPGVKQKRLGKLPVVKKMDLMVIATETIPEDKTEVSAFIKTAELMKLPPTKLLFVGDRPDLDIDNSKTAGMTSILFTAFRRHAHIIGKRKPDYEITNLKQVIQIVKDLNKTN